MKHKGSLNRVDGKGQMAPHGRKAEVHGTSYVEHVKREVDTSKDF